MRLAGELPDACGMRTSAFARFRILIAPGLHNSGPGHWQTRWQQLYPSFERVEQARWDKPELPAWSDRLDHALRQSMQPTLIVAHSFGCLATAHCTARIAHPHLLGALLVAPADPHKFGLALHVDARLPCRSTVIGSSNDPWMERHRAAQWAETWGARFIDAGALGHINADSHLDDWPYGLTQLDRLARTVMLPDR